MLLEHQQLLAEILLLAVNGSEQTGKRICHDVTAWGDGALWSQVRVLECEDPHDTAVVVEIDGEESPLLSTGQVTTLSAQREALAHWIAANQQEIAA